MTLLRVLSADFIELRTVNIGECFMKKELVNKPELKLIGLTARTNNKNEMNPQTSKIGELMGRYWSQNIAAQISDRKNPGVILSVYASITAKLFFEKKGFVVVKEQQWPIRGIKLTNFVMKKLLITG